MAMEVVEGTLQIKLGTRACQYPTPDKVGVTDFLTPGCENLILAD
jgi:hypothetical protein